MHVKNGANQNMSNHKLTGQKCLLTHRFWLGIVKMMNGYIDILQNLKTIMFMHGKMDEHHGVRQMKLIGNMQN